MKNAAILPERSPVPIVEFDHPLLRKAKVSLCILREDLNHPTISGNKWWKLRPSLEAAVSSGATILTFGGPWSNHIYATAAACRLAGLSCIGVIRGDHSNHPSATLKFAADQGMRLHFISREAYRDKDSPAFQEMLRKEFGEFLVIPEGGTTPEAVAHCGKWAAEIGTLTEQDIVCLPVGTGGTMAGMLRGLPETVRVIGFPVIRNGDSLKDSIRVAANVARGNWELVPDFHFGGYGKAPKELLDFVIQVEQESGIPLDVVYTAKMMAGILALTSRGFFAPGSRILAIHTGGLQGNAGFFSLPGPVH